MEFPDNINDLLRLAEVANNINRKKSIYSLIIKKVYDKVLTINDEYSKFRFNKLTHQIYDDEEIFFFNFVTKMLTNENNFRKRPFSSIENDQNPNDFASTNTRDSSNSSDNCNDYLIKIEKECIIDDEINQDNSWQIENTYEQEISEAPTEHCENIIFDELPIQQYTSEHISTMQDAFEGKIINFAIKNKFDNLLCVKYFLLSTKRVIIESLDKQIKNLVAIKINLILYLNFSKLTNKNKIVTEKSFITSPSLCTRSSNKNKILNDSFEYLIKITEDFQGLNGWTLEQILRIQINVNTYNPLRASSYIKLPISIKRKKGIINVRNNDQECFKWAMLSALHSKCNIEYRELRISYDRICECGKEFNFEYLTFPVSLAEISTFETLNNVSINVFGLKGNHIIGPLHHTLAKQSAHFNLLLIEDKTNGNNHYCYIENIGKLVSSQLTTIRAGKYICDGCLTFFMSAEKLTEHQTDSCSKMKTILPDQNSTCKFVNWDRVMKVMNSYNLFKLLQTSIMIFIFIAMQHTFSFLGSICCLRRF